MMTLFDMIEQAQNGAAKNNFASQFGLSQEQTEQALAALMPAFSAGLKQSTKNMNDLASFMTALGTGQHARYYEDAMSAFTGGRDEGNAILGHLFGSKEVSRAVAAQAAQATGIGQEILKQMLPVIASMVMGGLFKQSSSRAAPQGGTGNILGDLMGQIMGGALGGMTGGMTGGSRGGSANPMGDLLEQMMGGMLGGATSQPTQRESAPKKAETPRGEDIFGPMFDAGREVQQGYAKGMEKMVEGFLRGMDRNR